MEDAGRCWNCCGTVEGGIHYTSIPGEVMRITILLYNIRPVQDKNVTINQIRPPPPLMQRLLLLPTFSRSNMSAKSIMHIYNG